SNDPIPNRPDGAEWPLRIRSCNSPNCCIGPIPRIQRQELIVLDQRLLELPKCDACLYMDRQVRRIVFRNAAEARQIGDAVCVAKGIAEISLRTGAKRNNRTFFVGDDFGKILDRFGSNDFRDWNTVNESLSLWEREARSAG